ncbi:hypothetical protein E4U19_008229, partial [Claviceps sp. Clav32 group G5]
HLFGTCKYRSLVREQRIKDEEEEAKGNTRSKNSQYSSRSSQKKSRRGKKSHPAAHDSDSSADESSNTEKSDETVMMSRKEMSKSTPDTWAIDTGASSSMTDQLHLFRNLKSTSKVNIQ